MFSMTSIAHITSLLQRLFSLGLLNKTILANKKEPAELSESERQAFDDCLIMAYFFGQKNGANPLGILYSNIVTGFEGLKGGIYIVTDIVGNLNLIYEGLAKQAEMWLKCIGANSAVSTNNITLLIEDDPTPYLNSTMANYLNAYESVSVNNLTASTISDMKASLEEEYKTNYCPVMRQIMWSYMAVAGTVNNTVGVEDKLSRLYGNLRLLDLISRVIYDLPAIAKDQATEVTGSCVFVPSEESTQCISTCISSGAVPNEALKSQLSPDLSSVAAPERLTVNEIHREISSLSLVCLFGIDNEPLLRTIENEIIFAEPAWALGDSIFSVMNLLDILNGLVAKNGLGGNSMGPIVTSESFRDLYTRLSASLCSPEALRDHQLDLARQCAMEMYHRSCRNLTYVIAISITLIGVNGLLVMMKFMKNRPLYED